MRLIELELEDVFRFQHFTCSFHPGMNGIVGCNGIGKSGLLRSILWILLGDLGGYCAQADLVRQGSGDTAVARGRLVFGHGNLTAELTRTVSRKTGAATRRLVCGGQVLTRDADVTAFVESWLGLPASAASQHVFVGQDTALTAFLRLTPSRRAEYFQRLFRLDHAEKCRQAVAKKMAVLASSPQADLVPALARVSELETRLTDRRTRLAAVPFVDPGVLQSARERAALRVRRRQLVAEQSLQEQRLARARADLDALEDATSSLVLDLAKARGELAALPPRQEIMDGLAAYTAWKKAKGQLTMYEDLLENLEKKVQGDPDPGEPPPWSEEDRKEWTHLSNQLQRDNEFLATFNPKTGKVACPTCYTPTTHLADQIEQTRARAQELKSRVEDYRKRFSAHDTARGKRSLWQIQHGYDEQNLEHYRQRINDLKNCLPKLPNIEETELQRCSVTWSKLQTEEKTLNDACHEADKEVIAARAAAQSAESRLAELAEELAGLGEDDDGSDEDDPRATVTAMEQALASQHRFEGEISALEESLTSAQAEAQRLRGLAERSSALEAWRPDLTALHDALHWNAAPRRAAQHQLAGLVSDVNDLLDRLGIDFRIRAEADLGFRATFPDGRDVPAAALSGGESACLAVAWHLAVNLAYAAGVGLLCLDEPTAGLDADRLGSLSIALSHLRPVSAGRGLQCVVVTHERAILGAFDQVIDLSATPATL